MLGKMEAGDWFLVGIVCLQGAAVLSYLWKKRWLEAIVYTGYMAAQIALVCLSLRTRG